jgi:bifunctional non-homologous end joining protein LigD
MSKVIEYTTLGYCEGSSDKIYYVEVVEVAPTRATVNFEYGRRGGTMNVGTKTSVPINLPDAMTLYTKIVREKKAKGYTEIGTGSYPRMTAPATPVAEPPPMADRVLPQLLNPVEESELERLFMDDNWLMQPKMDGKRILLHRTGSRVFGTNRTGLECGIPANVLDHADDLGQDFILDGELIGDQYYVFDLLSLGGTDMTENSYHFRLTKLMNLLAVKPSRHDNCIHWVLSWNTNLTKREAFDVIKKGRGEGVVFKRRMSAYKSGRPASGGTQLKFKFVATASVVVYRHNKSKRSVAMSVFYKAGGGAATDIGNVTIGGAIPIPPEGSVIEVQYLYAYKDGSLFQPVYLGQRDDIEPTDCTIDQLKYKAEPEAMVSSVSEGDGDID